MGITSEEFFQNIYNVMFSPKNFFENENCNHSIRLAISVISFMAVLNQLAISIANKSIGELYFIFTFFFNFIAAILMWFLIAIFFEYTAKIFDKGGKLSKLLYLSAFSSIPAIFFAPLNLLKQIGEIGYILSVVLGCFLYLWIITLYAFAVKNTYNITLARAFMFIFLPLIAIVPMMYQLVGFCHKMWYIFSV